ncbi:MAG: DUF86 domain-containing protein [bacterium]|nr:DUF86 domain-containing protein [bacterium]MDZ4341436.1 DUF86 domain-containing protein [Candidatus Binatia bacterium]
MMVVNAPLDEEKLKNLLAEVRENVESLRPFADMTEADFRKEGNNYAITEHHFRRALEGVLTIGTHLLSRLPAKTNDYQEVIVSLGKHGVVPEEFAAQNRKLAGYRNRLVHLYWEISDKELHDVIKRHLGDLEQFCAYFVKYIGEKRNLGEK